MIRVRGVDRRTLLGGFLGAISIGGYAEQTVAVIDDFGEPGVSALGTRWQGFSDRVMGGVSDGTLRRDHIAGRDCLRLTGRVTTANNGGFLQMALSLAPRGQFFDATGYSGFEIDVLGNGERYNCHLRTGDVRWYDQSYRASFATTASWHRVRLPFSSFEPHALDVPLDLSRLQRVGLLGWMREFEVDLAVAGLFLYRE